MNDTTYEVNLDLTKARENVANLREEIEELQDQCDKIGMRQLNLNFYGCAFNFGEEGNAEGRNWAGPYTA